MTKGRLEAFSDGVIAIIITIMVLDLRAPASSELGALKSLVPTFLSYFLSYAFVGIYWTNHHHLLQATHKISGRVLWANLNLLFWLSMLPLVTSWLGNTNFATGPVIAYGGVKLLCAIAYTLLAEALVADHGPDSTLARALGRDWKGKTSLLLYVGGIGVAPANRWLALACYIAVALMWCVPDRRIERQLPPS